MTKLLSALSVLVCSGILAQTTEELPSAQGPDTIVALQEISTSCGEQPGYPGGNQALLNFIADNLVYPESAVRGSKEGTCYLRLIVDTEGSVKTVTVVKGVPRCPECDAEAARVLHMTTWTPAMRSGKAVESHYNLPVSFRLKERI